jgi:hypothetical protein
VTFSLCRDAFRFVPQDPDAIVDENDNCQISKVEAVARAKAAFEVVFANGPKIELEHHLVYHARKFLII